MCIRDRSKAVGGTPPEHFIRRQTLANAERFTTVRLKELEEKLLSAADRRKSLEYKLFQQLRGALAEARPRIQMCIRDRHGSALHR